VEHRDQIRLIRRVQGRAHAGGGDGLGGAADVRTKQAATDLLRVALRVGVGDRGGEDLVLAVLAPRLRQALELGVGRVAPRGDEVIADRRHLGQRQREHPGPRDLLEGRVVGGPQRHEGDLWHHRRAGARHLEGVVSWRRALEAYALDQRVMQLAADPLELRRREADEDVQRAGVHLPRQRTPEAVLRGSLDAAPDRIADPGPEPDAQARRARGVRQRPDGTQLADRVDEGREHLGWLAAPEVEPEIEVIELARAQLGRATEDRLEAERRGRGERVGPRGSRCDLQARDASGGCRGRHDRRRRHGRGAHAAFLPARPWACQPRGGCPSTLLPAAALTAHTARCMLGRIRGGPGCLTEHLATTRHCT
jgi:hypothetical protein